MDKLITELLKKIDAEGKVATSTPSEVAALSLAKRKGLVNATIGKASKSMKRFGEVDAIGKALTPAGQAWLISQRRTG